MDAAVHITIKVQQSHFLLLAAVWCLHLWATHTSTKIRVTQKMPQKVDRSFLPIICTLCFAILRRKEVAHREA